MAEARQVADWNRTATLWALHAELNRDRKKKPEAFTPSDIHPFLQQEQAPPMTIGEAAKYHQAIMKR